MMQLHRTRSLRFVFWGLVACLLLTLASACGPGSSESPAPVAEPAAETPPPTLPGSHLDADALLRTAQLLAGLDEGEGGEPWSSHAPAMEALWSEVESRHLAAMGTWAEGALGGVGNAELPVFYPFGGPDLPSVQQFFPDASAFVLVGLEPPGSLPLLDTIAPESLAGELERLRSGFENLAEKGYFVAKHMESDFSATHLDGFLPVLYISLARSGHVPTAVQFFDLADDGTTTALETVTSDTARSVKIVFESLGEDGSPQGDPRKLYYFAQDLSNQGLAESPGFGRFVEALGPQNVYMKAAMYLPHTDDFSDFNTLVMDKAQTLLQEDSGIPMRQIDGDRFDVTLFGVYEATLPNYREYFQPDLRDAYAAAGPELLPFEIGYNARIAGSCLIWAERGGD